VEQALQSDIRTLRKDIGAFVREHILPFADEWDREEAVPRSIIDRMAESGFLGFTLPVAYGGLGMDQVSYGVLNEEIGRGCSSLRSLITVHSSLVAETVARWGSEAQREEWLPLLAKGKKLAAFGLSEPLVGSDAKNITTSCTESGGSYILNGVKKWTTFGQLADVYIVIAQNEGNVSAFLVERGTPGLEVKPLRGMMGTRASMLAELHLSDCRIPAENLLGKKGWGFMQIVNTALDNGRYSVACGSTGISRACLEESILFAKSRRQFGVLLKDHQLTRQKITNMITGVKASRLLCHNAGQLRDARNPNAIIQTSLAKYFASVTANRVASDAVQLHGALGCHEELPIQRYFRDAKVMEIIEGSTEIQQLLIADQGFQNLDSIIDN
jgi:glutaryl-CoA dehydrogenase (non-decarboxylating)